MVSANELFASLEGEGEGEGEGSGIFFGFFIGHPINILLIKNNFKK